METLPLPEHSGKNNEFGLRIIQLEMPVSFKVIRKANSLCVDLELLEPSFL